MLCGSLLHGTTPLMQTLQTPMGLVRITGFSGQHCRRKGHKSPHHERISEALKNGDYTLLRTCQSEWRGKPTINLVLLLCLESPLLVVLKKITSYFLLITAYPPHPRQLRKWTKPGTSPPDQCKSQCPPDTSTRK